ncbi:MAG: efflux transporter outer membrane subunit [Bacteroidales bacterium]|nr:efflux transporter outer membrane subunit [Bacteroidales bacterium]
MIKLFVKISILSIIIASCKVGPNYQRPAIKSPGEFRFAEGIQDTAIDLHWWELFRDEDLNKLIKIALANNYDVKIAASRIDEAMYIVGYNKADYWPALTYGISGSRGQDNVPSVGEVMGPYNNFAATANLVWELDFWGKYRRSTEAAQAELLASEYGMAAIQIGLISAVAETYFLLLDYRSLYEISVKTLESRKESLRIIKERFDKGIVAEIDLNQAQIQEAVAEAAIPLYKRAVAQTEHALSILLGVNPGQITITKTLMDQQVPPKIPTGVPSSLIERRPDVLAAEQIVAAQNARIGVAQALRYPSISISGMLGAASSELSTFFSGDAFVWSVGAGIFGPIFEFNKNKRRVQVERERMIQDSLNYAQTVIQAFREVEDALIEISTLEKESQARMKQMAAAQNAAKLSKERYNGGVTSYLEVLDSDRTQFDSELIASDTYQQYLNAYVKLYKALGGGWITEEQMKQAQSSQQ